MSEKTIPERLTELKQKLRAVRQASFEATQRNDYLKVAKLTGEAARLNKAIQELEFRCPR